MFNSLLKASRSQKSLNLFRPGQVASFGAKVPQNHNLLGYIQWYQSNGHKFAQIDPLGLQK